MAGYPPPYPPPPSGPPYGVDPRLQARLYRQQLKAQRRAQKQAFVAQAAWYRQQNRAWRRSSILGPLLVVAFGVVLLLIHLGRLSWPFVVDWYGRWWPLLLVCAGLLLLLEWAIDQRTRPGQPAVRRGIGGGAIFFLLLLALAGPVVAAAHRGHVMEFSGINIDGDNLSEIFSDRHDAQQTLDEAFPANASLEVDNPRGDVTITGTSTDGRIHVIVDKQVYASSRSDSESREAALTPQFALNGSVLRLTVPGADGGSSADLQVTLPAAAATSITADRGAVNVSGMHAPVSIIANRGDVELNAITAPVTLRVNRRDSSVTAHDIGGDFDLKGRADDLTLTGVTGRTTLEGDFYGDTHLERLNGPVTFQTSRTQFTFAQLQGSVDISSGSELTGSQIVGPTQLTTSSRNIELTHFTGGMQVINRNGSVDLIAAPPLGAITVANANGDVTLTVPTSAGLSIAATTRDGDIHSDLSGPTIIRAGDTTTLTGAVGTGAAHVQIDTTHAQVNLRQAPEQPLPPTSPAAAPSATPPPPAAPVAPPAAPHGHHGATVTL